MTSPLAYIQKDGNILLIKRGTPPFQFYWSFPGGVAREDESPEEACIREVREETGIIVEVHEKLATINGNPVFLCRPTGGTLAPNPPESLSVRWFKTSEAIYLRIPPFIREFLKSRKESEG